MLVIYIIFWPGVLALQSWRLPRRERRRWFSSSRKNDISETNQEPESEDTKNEKKIKYFTLLTNVTKSKVLQNLVPGTESSPWNIKVNWHVPFSFWHVSLLFLALKLVHYNSLLSIEIVLHIETKHTWLSYSYFIDYTISYVIYLEISLSNNVKTKL